MDNEQVEEIKQLLSAKTTLPTELAAQIVAILPKLQQHVFKQLRQVLGSDGFGEYEVLAVLGFIVSSTRVIEALTVGDVQLLNKLFVGIIEKPDLDFGRVAIPLILDIRMYILPVLSSQAKGNLGTSLVATESNLLRYLPESELHVLVSNSIIELTEFREDIVKDFRWMYYVASPVYDNGAWGRQFLPLLKKNQEILGEKIVVGDKELAPTVENWLLEYDAFTGKPGPQREAFDRLHFVQNNQNAKLLSKENAGVLLKLCELYDWFSDPYVTEAEVSEFEDMAPATQREGLRNEENGIKNQVVRDPEGFGDPRRESRIKIDETLRSNDLFKMKESGINVVSSTSNKMDSGLPSQGFVETGMTAPKKQVQKSKLTPSNFAPPSLKLWQTGKATSDRHSSSLTSTRKALPAEPEEKLLSAPTLADIKAEAEERKQKVQADIDRKLTKLKNQESSTVAKAMADRRIKNQA